MNPPSCPVILPGTFQGCRAYPLAADAPGSMWVLQSDHVSQEFAFESFQRDRFLYTSTYTMHRHTCTVHICISAALKLSSKTLARSPRKDADDGGGVPVLATSLQGAQCCDKCLVHLNSLNSQGSPESQNVSTGILILISQLENQGSERWIHCPKSFKCWGESLDPGPADSPASGSNQGGGPSTPQPQPRHPAPNPESQWEDSGQRRAS